MTDLLKSMLGGLARFVLAWLLPVAVGVGLFWAVCVPVLAQAKTGSLLTGASSGGTDGRGGIEALGLAAFATLTVSTLLAYASQLIYRVLEGYHLPPSIDRRWTTAQRKRHARLAATESALERSSYGKRSKRYGLVHEQLGLYPQSRDLIMPTRLGNALKTLEGYGQDRFGLDSQQFWFELIGTAQDTVRRETEEARAQVDLFVASVTAFSLLSLLSTAVGVLYSRSGPVLLGVVSALIVPLAYRSAVRNMKDWNNSVRAMVNLGRIPVAESLGVVLPRKLSDEQTMWRAVSAVLHYRSEGLWRYWLDVFRRGDAPETSAIDASDHTTQS